MKAILTLNKGDLLNKLKGRLDEIDAAFQKKLDEIQEIIDTREAEKDDIAAFVQWHKDVAEGLASGEITLTKSGALKGAPGKPGSKTSRPKGSSRYSRDWEWYDTDTLNHEKKNIEANRDANKKPVQTAIDLIELSVGETVEVDAADYQNLLNGDRRYY